MNDNSRASGELFNPFPGLRPFRQEESHLFFGREGQSKSVLHSLEENHFVAVIGASGSGKSSLIYCGVIPGILESGKKNEHVLTTRPGTSPVVNFLTEIENTFPDTFSKERIETIRKGDKPLLSEVKGAIPGDASVLLVVDQFEEIFRYKRSAESEKNIKLFVDFICDACKNKNSGIRVVLTMRSDFIGDCSEFQNLTDLINQSNYLVPQMTREDFRKAIEGPVKVGGATIDKELVEQLLDEMGAESDQLPVLQHSLMRTWDYWMLQNDLTKPISRGDYEAIGRMEKALSDHANEAYDELNEEQKVLCEYIFKTLTEKGGDNRGVRRPARVNRIAEIVECSQEEVFEIMNVFRIKGRTFITPYMPAEIGPETVIDVSHESLMRIWDRLRLWVDEEAASVNMYKRLSEASALYQEGTTGLWRPPDLQLALNWREKQKPTAHWALQYNPAYERAMVYLETSEEEFKKEEENKLRLQRRRLKTTRIISLVFGAIAVVAIGMFLYTSQLRKAAVLAEADALFEKAQADTARLVADTARMEAEESAQLALRQMAIADSAKEIAQLRAEEAQRANLAAQKSAKQAADNAELERRQRLRADTLRQEADAQRVKAQKATTEAIKQQNLITARSMAVKSVQVKIQDDPDLKALLALQAYKINLEFDGPVFEPDIFSGLYDAKKALYGEEFNQFSGHNDNASVNAIVFEPRSDRFYSAGSDGKILLQSIVDTARVSTLFGSSTYMLKALSISPDGKYLASGTDGGGIVVYNLETEQKDSIILLDQEDNRLRGLEFSDEPGVLFSRSRSRKILKWIIEDQSSSIVLSSSEKFHDFAYSGERGVIAASDNSKKIYIYDLQSGLVSDTLANLNYLVNEILAIDFSNDGKYMAAGDIAGNVWIIETEKWTLSNSLRISTARLMDVKFSTNDTYLATSGYDGKVLMWDFHDLNNSPLVMEDDGGFLFCVNFSEDERYLLSGSNHVTMHPVSADMLVTDFCDLIFRNFTEEEWQRYVGENLEYEKTCPNK